MSNTKVEKFTEQDEGINCCDISIITLDSLTDEPTELEMEIWKEEFQGHELDGLIDSHYDEVRDLIMSDFDEMVRDRKQEIEELRMKNEKQLNKWS
jgi:hypothetical protein